MGISDQLHAFGHFTPRERILSTHGIGSWVGPRVSLDVLERRRFPCTPAGIKIPIIQPIT